MAGKTRTSDARIVVRTVCCVILILRNDLVVLCDLTASTWLLGQQADVSNYILHFSIRQLTSPRMHGAEDDPVFNGPQQFFVGF
jgi:hypothetical protein